MLNGELRPCPLPVSLDAALRWFGLTNHAWWVVDFNGESWRRQALAKPSGTRLVIGLNGGHHRWRGFLDQMHVFLMGAIRPVSPVPSSPVLSFRLAMLRRLSIWLPVAPALRLVLVSICLSPTSERRRVGRNRCGAPVRSFLSAAGAGNFRGGLRVAVEFGVAGSDSLSLSMFGSARRPCFGFLNPE